MTLLKNIGGARRAITPRHAASSVPPTVTTIGAPCVLAWLGASAPGFHRCRQEGH